MYITKEYLSGWGRLSNEPCHVARDATRDQLRELVVNGTHQNYIARGLGRAYGDSSLNKDQGVISQTLSHRFLDFDERSGVLRCEAGVSLREIIGCFLPRGWFLPVTPGTKDVTIGGAIAADVHGKNHHVDGSFGNFVLDLDLLTSTGSVLTCSSTQNQEIFWATVGGMGLTGIILSARIRLREVQSAFCNVTYRRTKSLDETLACFEDLDDGFRYSVAWIDCLARGKRLGRSVVMLANEARVDELPTSLRTRPLILPSRRTIPVPCEFPSGTLNRWSVAAFNSLYYSQHPSESKIIDIDSFFYPLDGIKNWNRIYGRRGFVQYQALFPLSSSRAGLIELLQTISKLRSASFLAVLKSCGDAGKGILSYLHPGHTLALDIPNSGPKLKPLLEQLDRILLKHGGRLYLAKDATTTPDAFAAMYPRLDEFRNVKAMIDPETRFASSQARRLGIIQPSNASTSSFAATANIRRSVRDETGSARGRVTIQ